MTEPWTPVSVEEGIRDALATVTDGVSVVAARLAAYRDAERAYDLAYARAYMTAGGSPAHERRYIAEDATTEERATRDAAEVAYKFADRKMHAAESQLSAMQSVMRSVTQAYGAVGSGERF